MKTNAEMIANLDPFGPPLIADMDTGYGGTCYAQLMEVFSNFMLTTR
jgi:isocitrate lyase